MSTGRASSARRAAKNDLRTGTPFRDKDLPGNVLRAGRGKVAVRGHGTQEGRAGRGQADSLVLQNLQQRRVDRLLAVHEQLVVGSDDPVDGLEVQRDLAEPLEVGALETDLILSFDEAADAVGEG